MSRAGEPRTVAFESFVRFTTASAFALAVFVSVLALPAQAEAASALVWNGTSMQNGGTYEVPFDQNSSAQIISDSPLADFGSEGVLFFIPDPDLPNRNFVSNVGGPFGPFQIGWTQAGTYEVDVYGTDFGLSKTDTVDQFIGFLFGRTAHAAVTPLFIETIRFTIEEEADEPPVYEECCSSIAFVPGIKATELYEGSSKRWLPGLFNFDGGRLAMTSIGESVHDISVGEPIQDVTFASIEVLEIYEEFFNFLDTLESSNTIAGWRSLPYDWRYDVYDVATEDQSLTDGSTLNLADEIRALAATSQTGKVTIIAHSNGGLVGKALIEELGVDAALVDKFIMVGTPQLGTPSAIAAMLHGTEQGLPIDAAPFAMSKATARELSENMPGAYGLLPLIGYFSTVLDPVVLFDDFADTISFRTAYGETIDTATELKSFLLGEGDGRAKPSSANTLAPTILNSTLLESASTTRNALESWVSPNGTETIQIVGWGLDTPKAVRYYRRCEAAVSGCFMDTKPEWTADGDRTVVAPSGAALSSVETYYLNLSAFNNAYDTAWTHANLLAASSTQDLLKDIILGESRSAPFVRTTQPTAADASKRLRVSVHSPATLGVRDSQGRFTGIIPNPDPSSDIPIVIEEIPNSYYMEFGNGKYIGFDVNGAHDIILEGTGEGTFTLEIEEVEENNPVNTATYSDVPVSPTTIATLTFENLETSNDLILDNDGDGEADETISPDGTELSLSELLALLKETVSTLDIKENLKKNLLKKIENLERKIEKKKAKNANILDKLGEKISKQEIKGKIDTADADEVLALLEQLEAQAEYVTLDPELLRELKEKIESLDIKQNLKSNLLKRVEKLQNAHQLTKMLSNLSKNILKKGEKGKIDDASVQELLDLLAQIETHL